MVVCSGFRTALGGATQSDSRSLTELHNGAMKVRSIEGVGTIVSVRIPLYSIEHQMAAE